MLAIDLVADKRTRAPLDPAAGYAARVAEIARQHGAIVRPAGTAIILAPPLVLQEAHADVLVAALDAGFAGA
jgi:adenosylmethionine-8-amino-7-oxononanoate aminotransferase